MNDYSVTEERSYMNQFKNLGDSRRLDDALAGVMDVLANKPDTFPIVAQAGEVRMAKTDRFVTPSGTIPRLRVWFRIEKNRVYMMAIKAYPDEED